MSDQNAADTNGLFDTALEQDSEVVEAQEGDRDPDAVSTQFEELNDADGEIVADDEAEDGEGADIDDPEADSQVTDALDIDSSDEADAAAAAAADEESELDQDADPYEEFKKELRMKPGKWYVIHSYAGFERRVKV
ncbi:MAG: transcription termination/antitermination protein NusG, partial [Pseudoclavibacter sp.]